MMDEETLVARLMERDPEALEEFHRQYRARIFAVARKFVRDSWDAEEVVQDVLLTMHRKIHLFDGRSAFWSWVYRVSANAAKMKVRKYKRYPTPIEDDALSAFMAEKSLDQPTGQPDDIYTYRKCMKTIEAFLDDSDEMNREVYLRMDFEGNDKEKVAEDLDLSVSALKARLHRMRFALREAVEAEL